MKVFVTGASGFIGGSVAQYLHDKGHEIHGLVRDAQKAEQLKMRGITPVIGYLEDTDLLTAEAAKADGVVNAASSMAKEAATALVAGLRGSGKPLLHTSGTGMVSRDVFGGSTEEPAISDEGQIFPGEHPMQHALRDVELCVLDAAKDDVRAIVISNPLIYGTGLGLNPNSIQIPTMMRQAQASGTSGYLGEGTNRWGTIHVADMADLYWRALEKAPAGAFYFAANGEASFAELAEAIAKRLGLGHARSLDRKQAAEAFGEMQARYLLGSESRVQSVRARRELGWQPHHDSAIEWIEQDMLIA